MSGSQSPSPKSGVELTTVTVAPAAAVVEDGTAAHAPPSSPTVVDTPSSPEKRSDPAHIAQPLVDPIRRTAEPAAQKKRWRGGLMVLFVGIAVCNVVLASVLMWYVGYRATMQTADDLSNQLRSSVLSDCVDQVNAEFGATLKAAHHLRFLNQQRFSDFANRTTVRNDTGWATDLATMAVLYPRIARFGLVNTQSLFVALSRPTSLSAKAYMSDSGRCTMMMTTPPGGESPSDAPTFNLTTYVTTPIHTPNYNPPYNYQPEVWDTDSPADIDRYLGDANSTQSFTPKVRPFWTAASAFAPQGRTGGWSTSFVFTGSAVTNPFLGFAAWSSVLDQTTGAVSWLAFTAISLTDFTPFFADLPIGTNGRAYLMRPSGRITATSDESLTTLMRSTSSEINVFTSTDEFVLKIVPILLELNLITTKQVNVVNVTSVVPYRDTVYTVPFTKGGSAWTMQAQMATNTTSGLPLFVCIITKDSDFDGNVQDAIVTTGWLAAVIGVAAILASIIVTSCVTRPLMRVVRFMERAVGVIAMVRGEEQRAQLARLCSDWSADTHTDNVIRTTAAGAGLMHEPESIATTEADKADACQLLVCTNVGRSLREVDLMHRAFGSMLYSLASYDELEAINQAKRAFIRYIFHEVRVPFNAIVLGIEQMQLDLKLHIRSNPACASLSPCLDTMSIVHEQSEVVSRILNDVLSMQKIEDGALALEISSFDVEKMIRVALHAFRVPCAEKRLKVDMSALASLDAIVESARSTVPLLHDHPSIKFGSLHANPEDGSVWHAHVEADPYRLRQALANFVSNAIKFSRIEGTIQVALEFGPFVPSLDLPFGVGGSRNLSPCERSRSRAAGNADHPRRASDPGMRNHAIDNEDTKDEWDEHEEDRFDSDSEYSGRYVGSIALTIRVRDSGVGLSAENASRMFQQYAQVSANKNQSGGGTGLGLSISKSIVELHGGGIGVTSVEGEGSEFFFTIPNTRVVLAKVDCNASIVDLTLSHSSRPSKDLSSSSAGRSTSRGPALRDPAHRTDMRRNGTAKNYALPAPLLRPSLSRRDADSHSTADSEVVGVRFHPAPDAEDGLPAELQNGTPARRGALKMRRAPSRPTAADGPHALTLTADSPPMTCAVTPADSPRHSNADTTQTKAQTVVTPITEMSAENGSWPTSPTGDAQHVTDDFPTHAPISPPLMVGSTNLTGGSVVGTPIFTAVSSGPPVTEIKLKSSGRTSTTSKNNPVRVGARVLVVEDSLPNRKLLISILTHMKLLAVGVENGQECVDLFPAATDGSSTDRPADPFDVCIMDGNMPVMNGIDACRILRARGVSIPILALTGNALAEDVAAFIDAGATSVLTKPINRAQLLQALTLHLPASGKASSKR